MSSPAASHENVSLVEELRVWEAAGRVASLWLRDDDACKPSAALESLIGRLRVHQAPCLLAVVPMLAETALHERVRVEPLISIAMHGAYHVDHAQAGRRKAETPIERGLDVIVSEWNEARKRIAGLFGERAGAWYVPPWNRIEPAVARELAGVGFRAISTFADDRLDLLPPMVQRNTHVDIMNWKAGRVGRSAGEVLHDLATALGRARAEGWRPVGILLHHLVHDAAAWAALDALMEVVAAHPAARWRHPDVLLDA